MKYKSKLDIEPGSKLKIIKEKNNAYGNLEINEIVTLKEITHFPTRFIVLDNSGKSWDLFTYDFEEFPEE